MTKKKKDGVANKMWGGHYAEGPAEIMARINACLDADARLYRQDIAASRAHAAMLAKVGILTARDEKAIHQGLKRIEAAIEDGSFVFSEELEDIHMNVEARLAEDIGEAAGRLHTARSRNDQVATDLRLWVRDATDRTLARLQALRLALIDRAEETADMLMPGFTHLQPAQPITLGHHLMAYAEMFARDATRFEDARKRMNECPLGAAALAGTSFPIDRNMTAKALGFSRPMANSLDAVSDRDFAIEFLSAASLAAMHLSRLSEEIVLWTSDAFRFARLPETFTTGSSIMPQKRNPDAAELIRGKTGALIGSLNQLLITMKGLPLAYNKDLQETKPPVMKGADEIELMLAAMEGMIRALIPLPEPMAAATQRGFLTATDLADALVREANMPFREAHHATGRIVRLAEERGCRLDELPIEDLRAIAPKLSHGIYKILDPRHAAASRTSLGGTAPKNVRSACKKARKQIKTAS